jgi:hypothetical protein
MSLLDALLLDPYRINVWIAYRTDGVKGTGTQADPWDGSTNHAAPLTLSGLTNSGLEATATTSAPHGYVNNDIVTIDVQTNPAGWSGTFLIYGVTSTTFKYLMNNLPGGTPSGTRTASKVVSLRFDAIMGGLAANTSVHLGPTSANRPFLTKGYKVEEAVGLKIKPAMKITGSGMDVTTLRLVGQPGTFYAMGHDFATGPVDYFELSDLSIDCNLMVSPGLGNAVCGAVRVMGSHARVRRIKVINWGANAAVPLFVVSMVTADASWGLVGVTDCGIEEVIAISPASSAAGAAITVLHAGPKDDAGTNNEGFGIGPFIRNCFVDCGSPTAGPEYRALSMAWCTGGIVEGNQVHNTKYGGPYISKSSSRDLIVRNNFYKNVFKGPYWNLGTLASSYGTGSLSRSGTVATVTVTAGHFLGKGDRVKIVGSPNNFDGIHQVTGVSGNTFTFDTSVTAVSSSTLSAVQKIFGVDKVVVEANTVELATETAGELIGIHLHDNALSGTDSIYPAFPHGDVVIRDNKMRYLDGAFQTSPAYIGFGIQANGAKNLLIRNNVVESAQTNPIRNRRCGSVKYFNDNTPAGVLIQGLNEDNSKKYDELATEAEDALVLALFNRR